jgi:hypothetical protein
VSVHEVFYSALGPTHELSVFRCEMESSNAALWLRSCIVRFPLRIANLHRTRLTTGSFRIGRLDGFDLNQVCSEAPKIGKHAEVDF